MPKYYFHVRDRGEIINDPEGLILPDLVTAHDQCRMIVREVLEVLEEQKWRDGFATNPQFEIVNESGSTVLVVPFRDIRTVTRPVREKSVARHR
jgi:hypothetical protein